MNQLMKGKSKIWSFLSDGTILHSKVRGGALIYALFLSVLIAIVCSTIIISSVYSNSRVNDMINTRIMMADIRSVFSLVTNNPDKFDGTGSTAIDLYKDGTNVPVVVYKKYGVFDLVHVEVSRGWQSLEKTALLGADIFDGDEPALYLENQNNGLSVCGSTRINGKVFLPTMGVRKTYIEGNGFTGTQPVYGEVFLSNKTLPGIDADISAFANRYLELGLRDDDSVVAFNQLWSCDSVTNSFINQPLIISSAGRITLGQKTVIGNVIIYSSQKITVTNKAELQDVILVAPCIIFEKGFKGSVQAFATDSIQVQEDCELELPSFLGIFQKNGDKKSSLIIHRNVVIAGGVMMCCSKTEEKRYSVINIEESAIVYGQVYSNAWIELRGKVVGSVYTSNFILRTPSAVYENHLLSAEIDMESLDDNYCGINYFNTNRKKKIIKWVN